MYTGRGRAGREGVTALILGVRVLQSTARKDYQRGRGAYRVGGSSGDGRIHPTETAFKA